MIEHSTCIGTLGSGITVSGLVGDYGWGPKKKNIPAQICTTEILESEASVWIYNIIPLAFYSSVASG